MYLLLTFLIVIVALVALILGLTAPKQNPVVKKASATDPPTDTIEKKPKDETKSLWQWFGIVDNTDNIIRAVVAGTEDKGKIIGFIKPGFRFDENFKNPTTEPHWLDKYLSVYGKRWYGIPLLQNIRPLVFDRVPIPTTKASTSSFGEKLDGTPVKRYGVYEKFLRPTEHVKIDDKENIQFNVVSVATVQVINAVPIFTTYKDNFLQVISQRMETFLSSRINKEKYQTYKEAGKDGVKFSSDDLIALNKLMSGVDGTEGLGIKITEVMMGDPKLDEKVQEAFEKRAKAKGDAAAKVIMARGDRTAKIMEGQGQARATERNAVANAKRFEELMKLYKKNGASDETAVKMANDVIVAELNANAIEKLQGTYVAGNAGVQMGIPGGKK